MKNPYLFFFILIIPFLSNAQDTLKRNVSLLKESLKIDSLVGAVIKNLGEIKDPVNDSCFLLGLFKNINDAGFLMGLHTVKQKNIIFDTSKLGSETSLGYFEFCGYLVFVYGDDFMSEFFASTTTKKKFTFIKPTKQEFVNELKYMYGWDVFYKEGAFFLGVH